MYFLTTAFTFILGATIGSFLNVVIYRYNSGTSPFTGRSHCFSCGIVLSWYQLIPVLSFLASRGRCAKCGVRISWQYPIVEILSGLLFVAVFLLGKPIMETIILIVIFSTLLVIAVYDLRHQIIPDGLVALFAVLGIVGYFSTTELSQALHFPYLWTIIAGPMLFFPFWVLWFISQGRWIGLGDGKLALGIGWFLGATLGGSAIMLAFWIGAAYALTTMAMQKVLNSTGNRLSMKSEIPFGPFLILTTFIVYFTKINFFDGSVLVLTFL